MERLTIKVAIDTDSETATGQLFTLFVIECPGLYAESDSLVGVLSNFLAVLPDWLNKRAEQTKKLLIGE